MQGRFVVLGPQHPLPNLFESLEETPEGPAVLVTAGWRHDENATDALEAAIGRACVTLPIYAWFEEVAQRLPRVAKAYRARQERLVAQRELHRVRVTGAAAVIAELIDRLPHDAELVEPELRLAVGAARRVDDDLLARVEAIEAAFPEVSDPLDQPVVRKYHDRVAEILDQAAVVCIAGGHVAVLWNRMRFFGLDTLLPRVLERGASLAAWSAGAMALAERVVLFYDDPPGGQRMPEVLGKGFGLARDVVLLPHAAERLRLDHRERLAALAMRFAPAQCVALENGAWLELQGTTWKSRGKRDAARVVRRDGTLEELP